MGRAWASAAMHNELGVSKFTMPQRQRECELAMTLVLTFYDISDVCRIS
jgi:hypothetical protein